jgi:small subunit ribosomal protein S17
MTDENVNDETQDGTAAEPEATDAPEGVSDVENVPNEAAPEEPETTEEEAPAEVPASEQVAEAEPPAEEPSAEAEDPQPDEPQPAEPIAESEVTVEDDAPATEPEPRGEAAQPERKKRKRLPRALRRQRTKPTRVRPAERKPIARVPKPEHERGRRQERQGTVVSAGADKTIVVRVDVVKVHPMYKKVVKRSTKLHAHDEANEAKIGDIVRLVETRPLSKLKRWRLQEVVEAAK